MVYQVTSRLGLGIPGTATSEPASANGTTTTFKLLDADAAAIGYTVGSSGQVFRLYSSTFDPKEITNFTVSSITSGAGTTTVTFTPAAAVSTATTDRLCIPDITDSDLVFPDQYDQLDRNIQPEVCTSVTRPTGSQLYEGKLIWETDSLALMRYTSGSWTLMSNTNFPMGHKGFNSSGTDKGPFPQNTKNQILTTSFTAVPRRRYAVLAGCSTIPSTGNDAPGVLQIYWKKGATVDIAGTLVYSVGADTADQGTGCNIPQNIYCDFDPAYQGQITVGFYYTRPATGDAKQVTLTGYSYVYVEDIGSALN